MFNRENIRVRPLSEELEGIGLDPERVMDDIERNAGLLEQHFGSPPSSEAVRPRLLEEAADDDDDEVEDEEDFDDEVEEDFDDDDELNLFSEAMVRRKKGYRKGAGGKLQKVSIQQKRAEKAERRKKKGSLRAASRMYRKRFKSKIAKRRTRIAKSGKQKKGFITRMESTAAARLSQLREELETSNVNTGEPSPYEEAAINAGWLALLLGECFEGMGDVETSDMLYAMSDSAAVLSEAIEALEGELDESAEGKLSSLLEGVSKALAAHEDMGSPSLFEAIEMGAENGLYEDEEDDDEDLIDEEDDCDCDDFDDDEDDE